MAEEKQDDQHKHTFSNYVRIRDVVQKTCQRQWTITVKWWERVKDIRATSTTLLLLLLFYLEFILLLVLNSDTWNYLIVYKRKY